MTDDATTTVVLVRHGETAWSRSGRHTGATDIELTEAGRHQALALAPRLSTLRVDHVFSSPLSRAAETCRLAGFADRAVYRDELLEWDYGVYEGLTTAQIHERAPGWTVWRDGCPEGEQPTDVARRVDAVIGELRAAPGLSLIFAHGHLLRALAARWIELGPDGGAHLALSTAAVSVLGELRGSPALELWNDSSHLGLCRESEVRTNDSRH